MNRPLRAILTIAGSVGLIAGALIAVRLLPPALAQVPMDREPLVVTTFGAWPDDGRDDTAAVQQALDALRPGGGLIFPAGTYQHSSVLTARVPDTTLTGEAATLTATHEASSAFRVDADRVVVEQLSFGITATTRRYQEREQHKIWVSGHEGVVLSGVTVTGSAAAGIFVDGGASDFRIDRATVSDTRADGIHLTGGAHDGTVTSPTVARTGDDGVAVVSYERDAVPCSGITVSSPRVSGTTWGRGLSVVGGRDIIYADVYVEDSDAASVYVAVEGDPYYTWSVENVMIAGGRLVRSNVNTDIDHGAIVVHNGRPDARLADVHFQDLIVENTRATASHDIGVFGPGPAPTGLTFENVEVIGGPGTPFGGDVPRSAYRVEP